MSINESGILKEIMAQPSSKSGIVSTSQLKNVRFYTTHIEICLGYTEYKVLSRPMHAAVHMRNVCRLSM